MTMRCAMLKKEYSATAPLCRVTFTLPVEAAKGGKEVRLVGEFNAWKWENGYRMNPRNSEFAADVELAPGRDYQFRYLIDNKIWENHWQADAYLPTPFGVENSVVSLRDLSAPTPVVERQKDAPLRAVGKPVRDDLTKIEGIGPKIAELLKAAGIVTFADLAAARLDTLNGILRTAGKRYQMHDPSSWSEQATLAARGEWSELDRLQRRLTGGIRH